MTMVTVFRDYAVQGKHPAAPSAFDVTPQKFDGLPAHMRSDLCRLLTDAGYSVRRILQLCGISAATLAEHMAQRHHYSMPERGQAARHSGERITPRQVDEIVEGLDLYACRVLMKMPKVGRTHWRRGQIEDETGLRHNHGVHALKDLQAKGLVRPIGVAEQGFIQPYELTKVGAVVAEAIDPRDISTATDGDG